jgi:hypothetical protein
MNIPDHISESLETVFLVKILKFFDSDPDPGSGIFLTLDLDSDPGSEVNIARIRDTAFTLLRRNPDPDPEF